ncbi:hypothetical protein ACJX0J_041611, partial [Zea mays]
RPQFAWRTVLPSPSALHQRPRVLLLPLTAPPAPAVDPPYPPGAAVPRHGRPGSTSSSSSHHYAAHLHRAPVPVSDAGCGAHAGGSEVRDGSLESRPRIPIRTRRMTSIPRPAADAADARVDASTSAASSRSRRASAGSEVRERDPHSGREARGGSKVWEGDPHGVPVPVPIRARDAHGCGSGSLESRPRIPIQTRRMTSIPRPAADTADARVDASTSAASSRSRRASTGSEVREQDPHDGREARGGSEKLKFRPKVPPQKQKPQQEDPKPIDEEVMKILRTRQVAAKSAPNTEDECSPQKTLSTPPSADVVCLSPAQLGLQKQNQLPLQIPRSFPVPVNSGLVYEEESCDDDDDNDSDNVGLLETQPDSIESEALTCPAEELDLLQEGSKERIFFFQFPKSLPLPKRSSSAGKEGYLGKKAVNLSQVADNAGPFLCIQYTLSIMGSVMDALVVVRRVSVELRCCTRWSWDVGGNSFDSLG